MFKNPTPQQIAYYSAAFIAAFVLIFSIIVKSVIPEWAAAFNVSVLPLLVFTVSFLFISYLIEVFVYRRIKVIYKKMTDVKKTDDSEAEETLYAMTSLEEVEQRVGEWAEKKNKQIASLQELESYRRTYLGDVSHELKTPIFNLQGFLHTLLDGGMHDPEIATAYLQKAAKNAERLQTIIEDLESISRIESGKMILDMTVFDILHLTMEVFDDLELKARAKNIRFSFKEGASQGWQVRADREAIRQVLTNLVNNSIKYGRENGTTKIGFYDMDKIILVEVTDNGIGIARHHIRHVFDRFYRVDKSRSRAVGGSGLGLSIVKHIVEAHGQSVHLRSTEGVGSTFGLTLEKA
jgi:two-component system phosphate regulon sensor histidine kinase PhoR